MHRPPDADRRPASGAPTETLNPSTEPATQNTRPQPSSEMLASPTLGAWRRANGVEGWSDYARVAFAVELVQEARRRILIDRLEGVHRYLVVGGNVDHAIARLRKLIPATAAVPMDEAA